MASEGAVPSCLGLILIADWWEKNGEDEKNDFRKLDETLLRSLGFKNTQGQSPKWALALESHYYYERWIKTRCTDKVLLSYSLPILLAIPTAARPVPRRIKDAGSGTERRSTPGCLTTTA